MCGWNPGTLSLYQYSFSWILPPYTRLNLPNPPYLHDPGLAFWLSSVNWIKLDDLIFLYFWLSNSRFPSRLKFSTKWSVFWKMILYSRPKLFDLHTLSQSKLLENHTPHTGTYRNSRYMAVPTRDGMPCLRWKDHRHLASHAGVFRGARLYSLPTNAELNQKQYSLPIVLFAW